MINLQLIKNFFVIIVAIFIIAILFVPKNKSVSQEKFEGEIYNQSSSKLLATKEEPNLKQDEKSSPTKDLTSKIETVYIYSDLKVPDEFLATKTTDKSKANYFLVSTNTVSIIQAVPTKTISKKVSKEPKTEIKKQEDKIDFVVKEKVETKKEVSPTISNKEPIKEEDFNYSILNDIIKTNQKTYFYADNFKNSSDVAVGIYSITPYKNYHILKFQVKNNSTSYFFVGNVEIKKGSKLVVCKKYFDTMVAKNRVLEGIILAQSFDKNDKIKFKLAESGNKNRKYEITIKIP